MSCQFLLSRTLWLAKKVAQKGNVPGRTLAEGHYENRLRSSGTACSVRSAADSSALLQAERRLSSYAQPPRVWIQQDFTFIVVTPFAYTPLHATYHMHTSASPQALRDILGMGRRKSNEGKEDSAMKEVTHAINKLNEDPLLQFASLEPKLSVPHPPSAPVSVQTTAADTADVLLGYIKLAQAEAAVKTPMSGTIGTSVQDEDLKALESFASLGDRKDE